MKAIKILKELIFTVSKYTTTKDIEEAIAELEELSGSKQLVYNHTCDSCKYYVSINKSNTMICSLNMDCIRKYKPKDRWESK